MIDTVRRMKKTNFRVEENTCKTPVKDGKVLNRDFTKENSWMANEPYEKMRNVIRH